jgi:hypothetical protein
VELQATTVELLHTLVRVTMAAWTRTRPPEPLRVRRPHEQDQVQRVTWRQLAQRVMRSNRA